MHEGDVARRMDLQKHAAELAKALRAAEKAATPGASAIDKKIKEIVAATEKQSPGKRAEVAEMFAGKSYMLFVYTFIKDVRCVYVPPRSIGEFGGENDNWVWPRHTGDFSFLRAYVAPDGTPADYSADNVPFHPKKFLKVAPKGVDENDAVFILGYPGRTFRHRTSHYLGYEQPVGEHLKYLVWTQGRPVACLAWSSAPRHLGSRDRYLGWSAEARRRNIRFIAYNTRFLILPWVRVEHLASHILGRMAARISPDWQRMYGHPIYFLETFVDPERFRGTCYRAANWVLLGKTTGRGKQSNSYVPNRSIKEVLGYPLTKRFRELLAEVG